MKENLRLALEGGEDFQKMLLARQGADVIKEGKILEEVMLMPLASTHRRQVTLLTWLLSDYLGGEEDFWKEVIKEVTELQGEIKFPTTAENTKELAARTAQVPLPPAKTTETITQPARAATTQQGSQQSTANSAEEAEKKRVRVHGNTTQPYLPPKNVNQSQAGNLQDKAQYWRTDDPRWGEIQTSRGRLRDLPGQSGTHLIRMTRLRKTHMLLQAKKEGKLNITEAEILAELTGFSSRWGEKEARELLNTPIQQKSRETDTRNQANEQQESSPEPGSLQSRQWRLEKIQNVAAGRDSAETEKRLQAAGLSQKAIDLCLSRQSAEGTQLPTPTQLSAIEKALKNPEKTPPEREENGQNVKEKRPAQSSTRQSDLSQPQASRVEGKEDQKTTESEKQLSEKQLRLAELLGQMRPHRSEALAELKELLPEENVSNIFEKGVRELPESDDLITASEIIIQNLQDAKERAETERIKRASQQKLSNAEMAESIIEYIKRNGHDVTNRPGVKRASLNNVSRGLSLSVSKVLDLVHRQEECIRKVTSNDTHLYVNTSN